LIWRARELFHSPAEPVAAGIEDLAELETVSAECFLPFVEGAYVPGGIPVDRVEACRPRGIVGQHVELDVRMEQTRHRFVVAAVDSGNRDQEVAGDKGSAER
jgi:hypothetical protein